MKKLLKICMIFSSVFIASTFISCSSTKTEHEQTNDKSKNVIIGMPNPYENFETKEEAENKAGITITLPENKPEWAKNIVYRAKITEPRLLEIIYTADDTFTRELRIRKAAAQDFAGQDLSGDFNTYDMQKELKFGAKTVNARLKEDKIYLVTWEDKGYAFSLRLSEGANQAEFEKLVEEIK